MHLTPEQKQSFADLRKGAEGALEGLPEERRGQRVVAVPAVALLALLDALEGKKADK